jgi:hypothetical protein
MTTAERHLDYVTGIPKALPPGKVLVHNHVIPQLVLGRNGFRAWTQPLDDNSRHGRCMTCAERPRAAWRAWASRRMWSRRC